MRRDHAAERHRVLDLSPAFTERWHREPRFARVACSMTRASYLLPADELATTTMCPCGDRLLTRALREEIDCLQSEPWRSAKASSRDPRDAQRRVS